MTKVTQANDSLLASLKLGEVEEVNYDSFDGKPIQGWIVKPPDFDKTKKYPFILEIHGGPPFDVRRRLPGRDADPGRARLCGLLYQSRGSTGYGEASATSSTRITRETTLRI